MANYDFDDGDSGSSSESIKLEPPCMVRVTLDGVFSTKSRYGQSLGVGFNDVSLVDGILAEDTDSGNMKVLSWDAEMSVPTIDENTSVSDLPEHVQRNYVGNTYEYEVLEARLEEDEDIGYGSDPEEEIEIGDFVFFTGATDDGPKSASKTLAKILSSQGSEAVVDEDSQDAWLGEDVAMRDDLMGREVIIAMTKRESDETGRTFHHPYVLDGKTRAPIFVDNTTDDSEGSDDSDNDTDEEDEEEEGSDMPDDLQSFYSTCNDLSINNADAVEGLLDDMLDDGDVSEASVEEYGRDEIIADLT